jgi:hypothetical protein
MEATPARSRREQAGYDEDALDRLGDRIADRLAVRLGGLIPEEPEALVDAAEIARIYGRARSWVYQHARELGAVRLGGGPRPRLGFSPGRVAAALASAQRVEPPEPATPSKPRCRRIHECARAPRCFPCGYATDRFGDDAAGVRAAPRGERRTVTDRLLTRDYLCRSTPWPRWRT